ncbi:MAG: hypothetical protein JW860_12000, partial [Sedimentisphaerales bacterium]|nr:hypothetical protein [Sedimentisphaerales bacterium]
TANIEQALMLAEELAGDRTEILIVSDHAPGIDVQAGSRIQWWSFGQARANMAIVNAARTIAADTERLLLEIANLSAEPGRATLLIEAVTEDKEKNTQTVRKIKEESIFLAPDETRRIIFDIPGGLPLLRARLNLSGTDVSAGDNLAVDNEVKLLPARVPPVRVSISISDEQLQKYVMSALEATGRIRLVQNQAQIIFTDNPAFIVSEPATWLIRFITDSSARAYIGPFVMDRSHPICDGVSLNGVVWGAVKAAEEQEQTVRSGGRSIIMAGNIPLIRIQERLNGSWQMDIRFQHELSTLQETASWPVLISNIVQWRSDQRPGVQPANLRLGTSATVTLDTQTQEVWLTAPDGRTRELFQAGPGATALSMVFTDMMVAAEQVGLYEVTARKGEDQTIKETWRFAVNALNRQESDLSQAVTKQWGDWRKNEDTRKGYVAMAWLFALPALVVLIGHLVLVARQGKLQP